MALYAAEMLDLGELQTLNDIADRYQTDPNLILAIGWHETQWGRLGDGQQGMYTGYGSYDNGSDYGYSGFAKQVEGTAYKMMQWGIQPGNVQLANLQLGNAGELPSGIYATDGGWPNAVYKYYQELSETGGIESALEGTKVTNSGTGTTKNIMDSITGKKTDDRLSDAANSTFLDYLKAVNYSPTQLVIDKLKSGYNTVKTNTTAGMSQTADKASALLTVDTYKWTRYGLILLIIIIAIVALFMGLKPTQKMELIQGGENIG